MKATDRCKSYLAIKVTILLTTLLLTGCITPKERYSYDKYQIALTIYTDNTCEFSINDRILVSRDASLLNFKGPVTLLDNDWTCHSLIDKEESAITVKLNSPSCCGEKYVISEQTNVRWNELKYHPSDVKSWGMFIAGGAVEEEFGILFYGSLLTSLVLLAYEMTIVADPHSETVISVSGLARRASWPRI